MARKSRSACKLCEGSKHRWDEKRKAFVKCDCLKVKERSRLQDEAGIPTRYDGETWKTWAQGFEVSDLKKIVLTARALKAGDSEAPWVLVHGNSEEGRMMSGALMARSACEGGLAARLFDIPRLIDEQFKDHAGAQFLYELPVLIVEIGPEVGHKWNKVIMKKLVRDRWEASLFTMLLVEGDPSRVAGSYGSPRIAEAIKKRFAKIRVRNDK